MRISDWSSDVCSSDLTVAHAVSVELAHAVAFQHSVANQLAHSVAVELAHAVAVQHSLTDAVAFEPAHAVAFHHSIEYRQGVVEGKRVSVGLDLGGQRMNTDKKTIKTLLNK